MEHHLTEEQQTIRDLARTIAEEKVKAVRAKYDEEGIFIGDGSYRVRRVDHASHVITPVAGDGTEGNTGDGGNALAAQLQEDGAKAFVKSWNDLLEGIARKTAAAAHLPSPA